MRRNNPLLLIITGPPCSGKTTIGQRLVHDLRLPYFYKDGIKEILFDTLGWKDRDWSRQLGRACIALLFYIAEAQLSAGYSLALESNFEASLAASAFLALQKRHPHTALVVQCTASRSILFERYKQRSVSGERHPGHVDHTLYAEFDSQSFDPPRYRLEIGAPIFEIDTSDFLKLDYNKLLQSITSHLDG